MAYAERLAQSMSIPFCARRQTSVLMATFRKGGMENNHYEHFRGHEDLLKRIDDWIYLYEKRGYIATDFLNLFQQQIVTQVLGSHYPFHWVPDVEQSSLRCCVIGEQDAPEVVCLRASYPKRFVQITHRDIFGALMNLGLEKDQFGDIWVDDGYLYLYVKASIADYVIQSITQIHKATVSLERLEEFPKPQFAFETLQVTVAGERIDQFVSELAHISRAKAQKLIRMGLVHLNDNHLVETDDLCHNNDILSIRQVGRFKIGECRAITKRGNRIVTVYRFC